MSSYLRRIYTLPAELEESLAADLLQEGTLGASVETQPDGRLRLIAWFPPPGGGSAAGMRRPTERAVVAIAASPPEAPAPLPPGNWPPLAAPPRAWPPLPAPPRVWPPLPAGVELVAEDVLPDADWMAEYRRRAVPFPVGRTLLIDPREPDDPEPAVTEAAAGAAAVDPAAAGGVAPGASAAGAAAPGATAAGAAAPGHSATGNAAPGATAPGAIGGAAPGATATGGAASGDAAATAAVAGRRLLRLPARTAFGIGSHPSTSLALELLEGAELAGRAVLDAGTGTGILAFAALVWGAAQVVGFDSDPVAAFQARTNSRLNALHPSLFAGRAAALAPRQRQGAAGTFDVVVANVVPEEILPDLADLLPALAAGGELILSGLPAERADEVAARLAALGLTETGRRLDGEWVALQLVRGAGGEAAGRPGARP